MVITLYKTKLSLQNRCYDKTAYDNYLNGCEKIEYTMPSDIIPNTVFYVPPYSKSGVQWQLYNYVTFEYAGMKYGSFIIKIQPLASNATVAIYHFTDNWFYLLENNVDFGMHGQLDRAHVNDFTESKDILDRKIYVPTMNNTFISPESSCSASGMTTEYHKIGQYDAVKPEGWHYIYILVNNPNATGFSYGVDKDKKYEEVVSQYMQSTTGERIQAIQMLIVGAVNDSGEISCYVWRRTEVLTGTVPDGYDTYLTSLQDENITKIMISDIPPNPQCSIRYDSNKKAYIWYNVDASVDTCPVGNTSGLAGFPKKFDIVQRFIPFEVSMFYAGLQPDYPLYTAQYMLELFASSTSTEPLTYDYYYKHGLAKLHSPAYAQLNYCGKNIDYSQFASKDYAYLSYGAIDIKVLIQQDYSFQFYSYVIPNLITVDTRTSYGETNCLNAWDNLVTKSYFDKYDLSIASCNAKIAKTDLVFGAAKSSSSAVTGALKGASNGKGVIGKIAGAISGGIDGGIQAANDLATIGYKWSNVNAELDKTIGQINNGEVSDSTAVGYYAFLSNLPIQSLYYTYPNDNGYAQLAPLLHRYGYTTPLQLDEVYYNHKRHYFNYFKATSCVIEGAPTDIAQDVESMFESGTHLWSGTVGEWDAPNWQEDVYQWLKQRE